MSVDFIQHMIRGVDSGIARLYLSLFRESNSLVVFLFHSLVRNQEEIATNVVEPGQHNSVAEFRQVIEYYLEHGYEFVTPEKVISGLAPNKKYALITFDDGYFNNTLALPVLKDLNVPGLFFISTNHVQQNRCYWWDVLYRERLAQHATIDAIYDETISMKTLRTADIDAKLVQMFGSDALKPRCDIDRPLTPSELKEFAQHPCVHLGNHTADHAILTNYTDDQVREQVQTAQDAIREMTGVTPTTIAYPNGGHDDRVTRICAELGLKLGFTVRPRKSRLPIDPVPANLLRIGRFMPHSESPILSQCRTYRSDVLIYGMFRDLYLRVRRGQVAQ